MFCSFCGAAQENGAAQQNPAPQYQAAPQYQVPVQNAAPKKNNTLIIAIAAVAVVAVIVLAAVLLLGSSKSNGDASGANMNYAADTNNVQQNAQNDVQSQVQEQPQVQAPAGDSAASGSQTQQIVTDGYPSCYKRYELTYGENDYFIVFLKYRPGSNVVSQITGQSNTSADYADMLAYGDEMEARIVSESIPNAELSHVEMTTGLSAVFSFTDLDVSGGEATAAFAAEYLDLTTENGLINLADSEQLLVSYGFTLVDSKE